MVNFNTNQTRHFYVAGAIDSNVDTNGDIALKTLGNKDMIFSYKNYDGLLTASDLIKSGNIVSVKLTTAAALATKLQAHTVAINTSAVSLASLVGKTVNLIITVREFISYDPNDSVTIVASVTGDATNTANATAFHKALAIAIAKAMPQRDYPFFVVYSNGSPVTKDTPEGSVTGSASGVVLVQAPQKWVRGKLNADPVDFDCAFRLADSNVDNVAWGTETVADSAISGYTVIPGGYALADLEYFALGERGDIYRGSFWPNDVPTTYVINPQTAYNVLSIEYFYAGEAENVQKSPRLLQIAAPATDSDDIATTLYNSVIANTMEGRVEALEDAE